MSETSETSTPKKDKALNMVSKTLIYTFAIFGIIFITMLVGVLRLLNSNSALMPIPDKAIVHIDFNKAYSEIRQDDFLAEFMDSSSYSFFDMVRAIYMAAADERVQALSAEINITSLGLAQIQDISSAIQTFRASGKKTYIFSNGMGSFGGGNKEYYLASSFDEIWMQPNSDIGINGIGIEVPFFKNILQKIGIKPEFYTRYEYKTAVESFINSKLTPAYKEELNKLGSGLYEQLVNGFAEHRKLNPEQIKRLINNAPIFADKALEEKLIDTIGYRQEMEKHLNDLYHAKVINIQDYMKHISDSANSESAIALLVLDGVIDNGTSSDNPLNEAKIGSQTVNKQLTELRELPNLKALIVRVNSPGGSYSASDEIRFALQNFKSEKNIPIIISMSDYTASGGYFISLAGDYIYAKPATLTGSIGVLGGKIVFQDLWKKLGINWEEINYGDNADILSANTSFSPEQKKIFDNSLDRIYADFTQKVAKARNISPEKMNEIARGRVWLGQDALRVKLIDGLGGINEAMSKAKELANIEATEQISLIYYPRKPSFQEKLNTFLENGGGIPAVKSIPNIETAKEYLNILSRMQFDAVLPPFKIKM